MTKAPTRLRSFNMRIFSTSSLQTQTSIEIAKERLPQPSAAKENKHPNMVNLQATRRMMLLHTHTEKHGYPNQRYRSG